MELLNVLSASEIEERNTMYAIYVLIGIAVMFITSYIVYNSSSLWEKKK